MPVFAPLEEGETFSRFEIVHGVVCWAGGEIDLAPEKMRELSYAYERIAWAEERQRVRSGSAGEAEVGQWFLPCIWGSPR